MIRCLLLLRALLLRALLLSAFAGIFVQAPFAWGQQTYPSRPIRIIVPFSPGGGGDLTARKIAIKLAERTGTSVFVENRAGASGNIGAESVVRSAPDGYTLLSTSSTYGIQAALNKTPFHPLNDVTPIIALARSPAVLIVAPNAPFKTLKDVITAAKRYPGEVTFGTAGVGAIAHMNMEHLASVAGIRMTHVPYKGSSQALTDMLAGNIAITTANPAVAAPMVKAGRIRALAVGGAQRLPSMPNVPTYPEAGLPGFDPYDWKAILGPKGVPQEVVSRLNTEINGILKEKEFATVLEADGSTALGGTPADLAALIKSDIERWRKLIRDRKIIVE
jgi:tripartite-type tricarboxylate transporter receptor subunit TctC